MTRGKTQEQTVDHVLKQIITGELRLNSLRKTIICSQELELLSHVEKSFAHAYIYGVCPATIDIGDHARPKKKTELGELERELQVGSVLSHKRVFAS